MCGIAGLISDRPVTPAEIAAVRAVIAAEQHRGPDGDGLYHDDRAVLGHRRLSIIDLSEAGRQPMSNEDGSLWVTFNGEIYNYRELRGELVALGYRFRSQTDTEVLLHGYREWGMAELLQKLRGMFAFAIYECGRGLILARDRVGIKPLYYYLSKDSLLFGSEVKALLRSGLVPRETDRHSLAGFLMAGSVPSPSTIVKNVRCLPPGHWGEWRNGELTLRRYWDLDTGTAAATDTAGAHLPSLLDDTVRRHMISDVPVGVFLSGGVDSAGLVALASRIRQEQGEQLRTLTVVFDERSYSEDAPAREIAQRFHTEHREVRVTSADFRKELPAFIASMDQPTNDGINTYFVSKAARESGLKVVLSGLGGDEVFWGYKHYRWLARRGQWLSQCAGITRRLCAAAGYSWGRLRGRDNWLRMAYLARGASSERIYLTMRGFFPPEQAARLLDISPAELEERVTEQFGFCPSAAITAGAAFNYIEFKRYLHDQLLRDTDVFSMAHSIEARVPYLDHVLVEQLWSVAPAFKLDPNLNKPLLVRAVDDPLLSDAGSRKKRGFAFPMEHWMRSCSNDLEDIACASDLLDRRAIRDVWRNFRNGRAHWSRAWALAVLGGQN